MSGGGNNTAGEIGGGLLAAGAIASMVMTGGADAPLALEGVEAGTGEALGAGMVDATGNIIGGGIEGSAAGASTLGSTLTQTGVGINALNTADTLANGSQYPIENMGEYNGTQIGSQQALASNGYQGTNPAAMQSPTAAPSVPTADNSQYPIENMGEYNGPQTGSPQALASNGYQGGNPTGNQNNPWYQNYLNQLINTNNPGGGMNLAQKATLGGAGIATLLALQKSGAMKPNYLTPYNPTSAASMGLGTQMGANYAPNRASQWGYATGGIATPTNVMPADLQQQAQLPSQVQQLMSQYGVTPQEVSQTTQSLGIAQPSAKMAQGGITSLKEGSFVVPADVVSHFGNGSTDAGLEALHNHLGAEPIRGHGDGMSDSIPTDIDGKQPARVANGEALVHPEKVKELGNGSADAGAKKLYQMMNRVRKARTGNTKQGKQIKADKYLPT